MKKGLLALLLVAVSALTFGISALGAGTGNLVIHFQSWSGEYDDLGNHTWAPNLSPRVRDGVDAFGAYWEYDNIPVGTEVPFIAVRWKGGAQDWDNKLTDDVKIPASAIVEDETVHVYIFEGKLGNNNAPVYVADPTTHNQLVVYYDPADAYEETLGFCSWGWTEASGGGCDWGNPSDLFTTAGKSEAGINVLAHMFVANSPVANSDGPGFLIYAGTDATKKTGDIKFDTGFMQNAGVGTVEVVYVVNAGDGITNNENVYMTGAAFADAAFAFKLLPFSPEGMTGTYAIDPNTVVVKTSASVISPYAEAESDEEREAAEAIINEWFVIKEKTGTDTYGEALQIERVDFGKTNVTLNTFVLALADGNELDNTKEYEIFFNLDLTLTEKQVEVTLELEAPANTPEDAVLSVAGAFNGWTPGTDGYKATKVGDKYVVTFNVAVSSTYTTFEYKWTRGSWPTEEFIAANRPLVVPYYKDELLVKEEVEAWADIEAPANKYAAPVRKAQQNVDASIELDLDTAAPVLTFVSPLSFVGKTADQRIIEVPWGQPFDQSLFPRYSVTDNRDGDITSFVFVPKGNMSVLNTAVEGDYTIMLQVEDKWGNVTQETFIFRVVKGE
jgi:hypothetical protein